MFYSYKSPSHPFPYFTMSRQHVFAQSKCHSNNLCAVIIRFVVPSCLPLSPPHHFFRWPGPHLSPIEIKNPPPLSGHYSCQQEPFRFPIVGPQAGLGRRLSCLICWTKFPIASDTPSTQSVGHFFLSENYTAGICFSTCERTRESLGLVFDFPAFSHIPRVL